MMMLLFGGGLGSSTPPPVTTSFDGGSLRPIRRARAEALARQGRKRERQPFLHPEEIARQQREDDRYLKSLEKQKQAPAPATSGETGEQAQGQAPETTTPAAAPIMADAVARVASDELARTSLEERNKKRRLAALLLAID